MSKNITKADLVSQIAKQSELTKAKAEKIVNAIIDNIKDALVKGNDVALVGFGSFSTTKRSARTGRNPQTGKKMSIPAKTVPKFRAGKGLREAVNTKGKKKKK